MTASAPIYAIHTVFVALENILFMEEWIDYHLRYGFNRFYLYDNSKSQGMGKWYLERSRLAVNIVPGQVNKYKVNYRQLVHMNDEEVARLLQRLEDRYSGIVLIKEWSPLDENGKVTYGQMEAHADCLQRMKADGVEWCANIDMDEFIVMGKFNNIGECVGSLDESVSNIRMSQIRFHDRFRQIDKLVIDSQQGYVYPSGKACKNIYKVAQTKRLLVHEWEGIAADGESGGAKEPAQTGAGGGAQETGGGAQEMGGGAHKPAQWRSKLGETCFNHYMLPVDGPGDEQQPTTVIDNVNPDLKAAVRRGSLDYLRAKTPGGRAYQHGLEDWFRRIDALPMKRRRKKRILHYIYHFSVPTQTFVYDLIRRLEADTPHDNIVLCQRRELQKERPWTKALRLSWLGNQIGNLPAEIWREVFAYLVKRWGIDLIVVHFAEKTWDLKHLEQATGIRLPMIVMTHGYDVFQLQKPGPRIDRVEHLLDDVAQRDNVRFTAVSDYLAQALAASGVAAEKITVVPNTVDRRFYRHRKRRGFYRAGRGRPLRLLNIGRLFDLKGHRFLLEAVARFRRECDVHLTIVYGNTGGDLAALQQQATQLGIADCVTFEPYVDFNANPGYFSRFDMYIHSSTYSEDPVRKSESFGLAALEAIAAGLPVIATDAGATPSVLGYDSPHSRIVQHGSSDALFQALAAMHADPKTFTSNRPYAKDRLRVFSPQRQLAKIEHLIHQLTPD